MSAAETVRLLLLAREYEAALVAARGAGPNERSRLERMAFARLGRFAEAAAAGRDVVDSGAAEPEDRFRLAEILLKLGRAEEALEHGLDALSAAPAEARYVVPPIQAVLLDPRLVPRLAAGLAPLGGGGGAVPRRGMGTGINLPVDLPHYRPYEGPHPWVMGLVKAAPELSFHRAVPEVADLAAAIRMHLPRALDLTRQLCRIHPLVGRADAAAYVASRFPSCLYSVEGAAIDLLPFAPMSLGERPFVMVFDVIGNLFSPPQPFEDTEVSSRATPSYWILRAALEAPACTAIITNYLEAAPLLGSFFGSKPIESKAVFVNPVFSVDEMGEARARPRAPRADDAVTLLFTASANWRDEGFYNRGGVDVLNAFLDLAERYPTLRLILRSRLPDSLSARLRAAVTSHPRIVWRPGFVAWEEFRQLLSEADLFVMPSILIYRNGLVQAMRWGIVPVISDAMHAHEMVADGTNGLVVKGRGFRAAVSAADQRYVGDWSDLLRATDRPADATFHARYQAALAGLIEAPARIAALRARLLETPSPHCYGEADRRCFVTVLQQAVERAPAIDLSPEAVFPVQPRRRPGSTGRRG